MFSYIESVISEIAIIGLLLHLKYERSEKNNKTKSSSSKQEFYSVFNRKLDHTSNLT